MSTPAVARVEQALAAAGADVTNSFTSLDEQAPARAARIEAARPGPLAGLPIAVKDIIDHAGRATTAGSAFYRNEATSTAPSLRRLEDAGAVVVGRTGLHEFAFGFSSENPWFGPVRNPWDIDLSPGGSSGGSAAAVAAGIVDVALGTDTGGSVRVPAALCGVAGLKVTHGRVPTEGVFPLVPSLDTVGPIAATVDHLEAVTRVMADRPWDEFGRATTLVVPRQWVDSTPLLHETGTAFETFLAAAADAGLVVEETDLPGVGPSPLQTAYIAPEVTAIHREWREQGLPYGTDVAARLDAALAVTEAEFAEATEWRRRLRRDMSEAVAGGAEAGTVVLVTPTVAAMDKRIGEDLIDGHHYRSLLSWFTAPVNAAGLPAVSVPLAGPGRQPSVQLIGARWSEPALLATARALVERGVLGVNRPGS